MPAMRSASPGFSRTGAKTVQLPSGAARLVADRGACAGAARSEDVAAAVRFLGLFLRYHLDLPPDIRRNTLLLISPRL